MNPMVEIKIFDYFDIHLFFEKEYGTNNTHF